MAPVNPEIPMRLLEAVTVARQLQQGGLLAVLCNADPLKDPKKWNPLKGFIGVIWG